MDAVELNSSAVSLLQQGNTKDAVEYLLRGLADLSLPQEHKAPELHLPLPPVNETCTNTTAAAAATATAAKNNEHTTAPLSSSAPQNHQNDQSNELQRQREETASQSSRGGDNEVGSSPLTTVVYNGAFFLHPNDSTATKAAVMLYNAGLAYHRQGLQISDSKSLAVALLLYQRSYVLTNVLYTDSSVLLVAALYNNMIQLHTEFFHVREARQWREILKDFLQCKGRSCLRNQDLVFFHTSLFYSITEDFSMAPAA